MKLTYPCGGCDSRRMGCHGSCADYLEIKHEIEAQKQIVKQIRSKEIEVDAYKYSAIGSRMQRETLKTPIRR